MFGGIILLLTDNGVDGNVESTEVKGISMIIKENTLNGKYTYVYGSSFRVDKLENGE